MRECLRRREALCNSEGARSVEILGVARWDASHQRSLPDLLNLPQYPMPSRLWST